MQKIFKGLVLSIFCLSAGQSYAQKKPTLVQFENPSFLSKPTGYSHIARIDMGKAWMLIISGQVALDKDGNLVGKNDFAKQTEHIYQEIIQIIKASGGSKDHLVKTGIFILDNANIGLLREVRNKYINMQNPPASTLVQVEKLYRDDLLIEIEAVAVIPK